MPVFGSCAGMIMLAGLLVDPLAAEPRTGKVVAARQGPALATAFHPS
jgi:glutamine amidotransferase PdxT